MYRQSIQAAVLFVLSCLSHIDNACSAEIDPQCVHWASAFVFTEFMDRARVKGNRHQRLHFHKPHPSLCEEPLSCQLGAYVIGGDEVTIGNVCGPWAFVQFHTKRNASTGWVKLDQLTILPPNPKNQSRKERWVREASRSEPIVAAARNGNIENVRRLMTSCEEAARVRALFAAASEDNLDVVTLLLDNGVAPMSEPNACQLLARAIADSSTAVRTKLVSAGADVNCTIQSGNWKPLMWLAFQDRAMTKIFAAIDRVSNPDGDYLSAMRFLIDNGAEIDAKDGFGKTALRYALGSNNVDFAGLLLSHGADPNNYLDDSSSLGVQAGNTALMNAIFWFPLTRDPTMVELLLRNGADVNFRNNLEYDEECDRTTSGKCTYQGQTALTRAASDGQVSIVKLLLEHGANPHIPRKDGKMPLEIALQNGHASTAAVIRQYAGNRSDSSSNNSAR